MMQRDRPAHFLGVSHSTSMLEPITLALDWRDGRRFLGYQQL